MYGQFIAVICNAQILQAYSGQKAYISCRHTIGSKSAGTVYKHQYLGHITVQYIHCAKHKYNRQRGKERETLQNKAQGRKVSKKVEIKKTSQTERRQKKDRKRKLYKVLETAGQYIYCICVKANSIYKKLIVFMLFGNSFLGRYSLFGV